MLLYYFSGHQCYDFKIKLLAFSIVLHVSRASEDPAGGACEG